jgi:hypothetical protein
MKCCERDLKETSDDKLSLKSTIDSHNFAFRPSVSLVPCICSFFFSLEWFLDFKGYVFQIRVGDVNLYNDPDISSGSNT